MNTVRLPSGERTLLGTCADRLDDAHRVPCTSQVQRLFAMLKAMARWLSSKSNVVKGSRNASYFVPDAEERAAAIFARSNGALRVALAGSMRKNSFPFSVATR